ncbi:T9SS type A sorting domain-containing protein [Spirosoma sp. KNUC1025]|uniref:T9SS type A sorting domain-containing protein n=1 Tax=Spirosoma sp. KNUC1025 TaxID=2894082 RepID=UPI00386B0575|nr:T9SS type A sorting domain-containing protein [Spirosoma sp. KNUC1025]
MAVSEYATEFWRSDGTEAGTYKVKINNQAQSGDYLINVNGTLYFRSVGSGLWKSDGTDAGTVLVKEIQNFYPRVNANGTLFFFNGTELWKSNGTTTGTGVVTDVHPEGGYSVLDAESLNGYVYFMTTNDGTAAELWRSDGTVAGTVMLKSFPRGLFSERVLIPLIDKMLVVADDGNTGLELWAVPTPACKAPLVTTQPANQNVCQGRTASFKVVVNANSSGTLSYRWEYNDGGDWLPASGTGFSNPTTATLGVSGTQLINLRKFRVWVKGSLCPTEVFSSQAQLTVNGARFTAQPTSQTACASTSASFMVTAQSIEPINYLWEMRESSTASWSATIEGNGFVGSTTSNLTVSGAQLLNGRQFRLQVSTAACPTALYSSTATLKVVQPLLTTQPANVSVCQGAATSIKVTTNANSSGTLSYRWEYNDGGSWVTAAGTGFSNTTTASLGVSGAQVINGRRFRVWVKGSLCTLEVLSNEAQLTIKALPVLSNVTPTQTITSGQTIQGITATASGGVAPLTLTWSRPQVASLSFDPALALSGGSADLPIVRKITSTATTDQPITFTLKVTDATGCSRSATSQVKVKPAATASARLGASQAQEGFHIYPNPFNGNGFVVEGPDLGQAKLGLHTMQGRVVPFHTYLLDEGKLQVKTHHQLETGVYILEVTGHGKRWYTKLLVTGDQ